MHIALATDGSANGNAGVDLLIAHGPRIGDRVSVMVVKPEHALPGGGLTPPEGVSHDDGVASAIAASQVYRLQSAGFDAETAVLRGDPGDAIVRAAQERRADLIVMGIRGHSKLHRLLVGSVSSAVARLATVPVLLTRQPASISHVLVVSDNSDSSLKCSLAVQQLPTGGMQTVTFLHVNAEGEAGARIRESFAAAGGHLSGAGIVVEHLLLSGNEVEVALETAKSVKATLVIVAASDDLVDGERLIGTTARGLMEQAHVSVLIAR